MSQIKYVANAIKWFDKVNGNTYHSVNITRCDDCNVLYCQYQYGYGEQYRQTALLEMQKAGWLPEKYTANDVFKFERENEYPIMWNESKGTKRECVENGKA